MDVPDFLEEDRYNAIARFFHWVIAFLIIIMLGLGLTMGEVDFGVPRSSLYDLHKSLGLLILLLAIGRILWRFASVSPQALATHAAWERTLAKAAHGFLYFSLIAMPLSGWLMSDAAGRPPTFFGINVPRLLSHDDNFRQLFGALHEIIAWGLIGVIGLHAAGALKHHLIDKDGTLRRMAGDKLGWLKLLAVFLVFDIALMAGAVTVLNGASGDTAAIEQSTAPSLDLDGLVQDQWRIDPENSHIQFSSSAFGTDFSGEFGTFDGTIIFDPDHVAMAQADIVIDMTDVASGDAERDAMIHNSDWFNTHQFPQSRFATRTIQSLGEGRYIAVGDLTIRDVSMPVSLPFTLVITEQSDHRLADMRGQITLNRLDFGVGQGEWVKTEVVPAAVSIAIQVKAVQRHTDLR